jgi:hypothetical protein
LFCGWALGIEVIMVRHLGVDGSIKGIGTVIDVQKEVSVLALHFYGNNYN